MTDHYNNNKENQPVNGEYHYRTYDLENRQKPAEPVQEPQASFGSGDWQWEPAETEQVEKPRRKIKWGRILLSVVGVAVAAAICFTAGYAGVLVANQKNTVVIQQVMPGNSSGPEVLPVDNSVLTSAQVAANEESNAVFVVFAPFEDPQVALAIVVERGGSGSELGAIAADILTYYFHAQETLEASDLENTLIW